jgi:hypothetical protein
MRICRLLRVCGLMLTEPARGGWISANPARSRVDCGGQQRLKMRLAGIEW